MHSIASRPLLSGEDLDTAIDRARNGLAALLRGSGDIVGTGGRKAVAEARALLSALLDRRVTEAAARMDERDADERTTLYLFLALRDRQHLLACPADAKALMTWGKRLLTFPDAGGLGQSSQAAMPLRQP